MYFKTGCLIQDNNVLLVHITVFSKELLTQSEVAKFIKMFPLLNYSITVKYLANKQMYIGKNYFV